MTHRPVRVCIVGVGPRGLSVLERITANARGAAVHVHLVDPYPPGSGQVWRTDQQRLLLTNTVASQITMFTDASVDMAGPVVTGPSLAEWASFLALMGPTEEYEDWVYEQARSLGPDSYPTRAFYGQYLRWVFGRVTGLAHGRVRIEVHRARAVALTENADRDQCVVLADGTRVDDLDAVVLAQGHVASAPGHEERELARLAAAHRARYLPPANPADVDLSSIGSGEAVLLRGLGLCFFDYLSLLTVGRGGSFVRRDGRLVYRRSGLEPRLYAASRRGVPYHSRGENEKGAFGRHVPIVLTPTVIDKLCTAGAENGGIDFRRDLWPLIAKEVETVYYATLVAGRGCTCDARRFRDAYLPHPWGSPGEAAVLDRLAVPVAERWAWQRVMYPYGVRGFADTAAFRAWLIDYLREDVAEARLGNVSSPLKAALDVLRDIRNEVRLVVDHGGLTGRSHRDDLDGWYTPLNAFLSIGPPASRTEEAVALVEAGVLDIVGPQARMVADNGRLAVESPLVPGSRVHVDTVIEARVGEPDLRRTTDPLLRGLLADGQASTYRIADPDGGHHETGGLAVTGRPYRVVDAAGRPHPRRFAFGVPTESVHWVTAAGIRPGVNSVTLADADAIARAVLSPQTWPPLDALVAGGAHHLAEGPVT
ncbi:MAG TPA: FAD/NAD(P)-binding protein [Planosporangium sp.]|nr:FAD/NAD(P)-binding protein [Planosporangium sp.]